MKTETVTTHDIRVGDLIANYGMLLRIDHEPVPTSHPGHEHGGATLAASGP